MNGYVIALPDQSGQAPRIDIGMLFLLCESEFQDLAFQFDRTLAASLARQQRSKPQLSKSLLNLIEAFSAETELAAHLSHGVFIDRMGAQHLVFDLREVVRVEELHLKPRRAHRFRVWVQGPGSQQGLSFGLYSSPPALRSTRWRNLAGRQPVGGLPSRLLPTRQGTVAALPQSLSPLFEASLCSRETPVSRRVRALIRSLELRPVFSTAPQNEMGGLRQSAVWWSRKGFGLSGPLHASRGHLQQPAAPYERRTSHFQ